MKPVATVVAIVCVVASLALLGYSLLILWRFGKL